MIVVTFVLPNRNVVTDTLHKFSHAVKFGFRKSKHDLEAQFGSKSYKKQGKMTY